MQKRIRGFVAEYNRRYGATVLLTSHYMADVQALCRRVIVIHHGRLLFDGELAALADRFVAHKTIVVRLDPATEAGTTTRPGDLERYGDVIDHEGDVVRLRVDRAEVAGTTSQLLSELPVVDLTVEDPPVEDVIEQLFAGVPR
jgi:ABC-2 type transport system ATP-binding protein